MVTRNKIQPGDGDHRHGTDNGYRNHRCPCEKCRVAGTVSHYNWEHAKPERLARKAELMRGYRQSNDRNSAS